MTSRSLLLTTVSFTIVGAASSFALCPSCELSSLPRTTKVVQMNLRHFDGDDDAVEPSTSRGRIDKKMLMSIEGDVTIEKLNTNRNNRRYFLSSLLAITSATTASSPAWAAKGAAEYDFEYYMRDLFMGNNKEGNLPVSNAPPPHPPRTLQGKLSPLLLDNELQSCIPIQELAKITNIPIATLSEQVRTFRSKVQPAFQVSHPWKDESVGDEYYFDLTSYALWRTASVAIPKDYTQRDTFIRNIGRRLLNEIMNSEMISRKSIETLKRNSASLTDMTPCILEILNLFQSSNYCTGYRLGDKNDEVRTGLNVFDSLDDEEMTSSGTTGSVDCLVSVFDPATLGGALQITGEGSRFAPDFMGPTLAAVWERVGGEGSVAVRFESYFVDPVYRPNPKDFFPNERFYQFTIVRK